MDDHIIRIGTVCDGHWRMVIDLKELAGSAGIRKKRVKAPGQNYDEKVISVPMPRARKILKLIWQYGQEKDFEACDRYLAQNAKLNKYWEELRR